MSRTTITTANLHGYDIDELKRLRNTHPKAFARNILTAVIMIYEGSTVKEIASFLLQTTVNIYSYINRWNALGIQALDTQRGKSSRSQFTAEMIDDLLYTVNHKKPNDFELLGGTWTGALLSQYIYQNYEIRCCQQTIRNILHANGYSFKRAQRKPTKGLQSEQEAFKKNDRNNANCRKRF